MSGLKKFEPALRFGGMGTQPSVGQITPDEMDQYKQYVIAFPAAPTGLADSWFFLGTSGTANVTAIVPLSFAADYPRNLRFSITGSSVGQAGSIDVNGRDQFGQTVSETIGFGSADNGGTTEGTKVFAQITTGTIRYGTFAGVNGTARLGVGTAGTTALFGLPDRLGASTDIKAITWTTGTGALRTNFGSIGTYTLVSQHAIRSPLNVLGTTIISVLYKSTFNAENIGIAANLPQIS